MEEDGIALAQNAGMDWRSTAFALQAKRKYRTDDGRETLTNVVTSCRSMGLTLTTLWPAYRSALPCLKDRKKKSDDGVVDILGYFPRTHNPCSPEPMIGSFSGLGTAHIFSKPRTCLPPSEKSQTLSVGYAPSIVKPESFTPAKTCLGSTPNRIPCPSPGVRSSKVLFFGLGSNVLCATPAGMRKTSPVLACSSSHLLLSSPSEGRRSSTSTSATPK